MFLTVHGAIGIIIGQNISPPFWAFIIGFISHYILDIIPHGDTNAPKKYKNPIHIGLIAIIDFIILIIYFLFISSQINVFKISIFLALLGCLLPDFLQAFYFIFDKKIFCLWQKTHNFLHALLIKKFEWNFYVGIALQFVVLILLTLIIL